MGRIIGLNTAAKRALAVAAIQEALAMAEDRVSRSDHGFGFARYTEPSVGTRKVTVDIDPTRGEERITIVIADES